MFYKKRIENQNLKGDEGFNFTEVIVSIAIILVLSAFVGIISIRYIDKARHAAARSQIDTFVLALEAYYIDCGRYPTTEQGLQALKDKPSIEPISSNWAGPYIYKNVPNDPWGNPYEYTVPGPNGLPFSIRSFGADGREGGTDKDADIESWS